jgi:hypothetical protein
MSHDQQPSSAELEAQRAQQLRDLLSTPYPLAQLDEELEDLEARTAEIQAQLDGMRLASGATRRQLERRLDRYDDLATIVMRKKAAILEASIAACSNPECHEQVFSTAEQFERTNGLCLGCHRFYVLKDPSFPPPSNPLPLPSIGSPFGQ